VLEVEGFERDMFWVGVEKLPMTPPNVVGCTVGLDDDLDTFVRLLTGFILSLENGV